MATRTDRFMSAAVRAAKLAKQWATVAAREADRLLQEAKEQAESHDRKRRLQVTLRKTARVLKIAGKAAIVASVAAGIAAARAETVVTHGAAAANSLGLTTQVPTKLVYLTSGKSRRLTLGAQVVELKTAPQWMLLPSHPAAGEAVRALEWIGKHRASEALTTLKHRISKSTVEDLIADLDQALART